MIEFFLGMITMLVIIIIWAIPTFFHGIFNMSRCKREDDERREQIESGIIINKIHGCDND